MGNQQQQAKVESIIQSNPQIDEGLVRQFAELEAQLIRLGVDLRPQYRLSPPLGEGAIALSNAAYSG